MVLPFTSHFDSPQTESQGSGNLPAAGMALHVQQSAKMVQSLSFSHSGVVDSGAACSSGLGLGSDFVVTAVDSGLASAGAAGLSADAGDSEDLRDPPQAASNNAGITSPILR